MPSGFAEFFLPELFASGAKGLEGVAHGKLAGLDLLLKQLQLQKLKRPEIMGGRPGESLFEVDPVTGQFTEKARVPYTMSPYEQAHLGLQREQVGATSQYRQELLKIQEEKVAIQQQLAEAKSQMEKSTAEFRLKDLERRERELEMKQKMADVLNQLRQVQSERNIILDPVTGKPIDRRTGLPVTPPAAPAAPEGPPGAWRSLIPGPSAESDLRRGARTAPIPKTSRLWKDPTFQKSYTETVKMLREGRYTADQVWKELMAIPNITMRAAVQQALTDYQEKTP